jgi:probable F420-dependent oxidoreductase
MMKLGFPMPHLMQLKAITHPWEMGVTGADQTRLAKWAEKLGYEMIAVPEHHVIPRHHVELSGPFYFNAYTAMAYLAGATERVRVNSSIALLPAQNPIVTAKALSTMDWLSSGRVTITFGVGWLEEEFALLGVPFHERGAMAEEYIQAIIALWTRDDPEFEGKYVSFRDIAFEPKPVQKPHIPIWFGGDADPVLRRIGRYAQGWWPFLTKPEDIPARIDFIKSRPDYNGQLSDVFYGLSTGSIGKGHVAVKDDASRPGQSRDELVDRLGVLADLGVTWSSVPIPDLPSIDAYFDYAQWVAEEIMPAVR